MTAQERQKNVSVRRTDEPGRAQTTRRDRSIASARKWLRDAHRASGSWATVARDFGISSKGSARRIALGEAELPDAILKRFLELRGFRIAARRLGKRLVSEAIRQQLERTGSRVVVYSNRGKEVKP